MSFLNLLKKLFKPQNTSHKKSGFKGTFLPEGEEKKVIFPDFSSTQIKGPFQIKEWLCSLGDIIEEGQIICTIDSEEITMEFEAFIGGKITYINKKEGVVNPGELLAVLTGVKSDDATDTTNTNRHESWSVLVYHQGVRIHSMYAGKIRFGPVFLHLKSEPINVFGNQFFGDWFYKTKQGVYLQLWNSNPFKEGVHTKANNDLLFLHTETKKLTTIKKGIPSFFWSMKEDEHGKLFLIYETDNGEKRIELT